MASLDDRASDDEARQSPRGHTRPPIVAVGASAGGLEAFEALLRTAPPASGLAFVLLIHLDPTHKSNLSEILDSRTPIAVRQIVSGTVPEADTAYVIPPGMFASIQNGKLYLSAPAAGAVPRMSIDHFFRSMADELGPAAIGVVMSGTGSDGTLGVRAIRAAGGLTIAQREETAAYPAMPSNAIASGDVDHILPPEEIVPKVLGYVRHPAFADRTAFAETEDDLSRLLHVVRRETGHDFSHYKRPTIVRRVTRRMQVLGLTNVKEYADYLALHSSEPEVLFRDLLIRVTAFFRDPEAYEVLRTEALPRVLEAPRVGPIRVWVPGCATGEEAYSMAILLFDCLSNRGKRTDFQLFATDVDPNALDTARRGVYPMAVADDVPAEYLERFFVREGDVYRSVDVIRERIVFAPQDLVSDPPFSNMDLISCRNLLIYLDAQLQSRLLPLFHYTLNPGGILFLGPSENVGEHSSLFSEISRKWRIFQRKQVATAQRLPFAPTPWRYAFSKEESRPAPAEDDPKTLTALVERKLLDQFAPPSVVVDKRGDILHLFGRTAPYLELREGQPSVNVYKMARGALGADLRTAVHRAVREHRPVESEALGNAPDGSGPNCRLRVAPLEPSVFGDDLLLVSFEPAESPEGAGAQRPDELGAARQLGAELRATKEYLQATIEELETSNEELASANEELLAMNEEYQSSNEELETSREELQSVNEELSTVNTELKNKVEELASANTDIRNLYESTGVATVFVDRELTIRSFTPAATRLFALAESDRGRQLADQAQRFEFPRLTDALERVLSTEEVHEAKVTAVDRWYVMRLLPYHSADNSVDGVILTFSDVTSLKEAQLGVEAREARLSAVLDTALDAIITIDSRGTIQWFNQAAERIFGYSSGEAVGQSVNVLMPSPHCERHDGYLARYLETGEKHIIGLRREVTARRKDGSTFPAHLAVAEVRFDDTVLFTALLQDLTERRGLEDELRQAQKMEAIGTLASGVAHDFNNLLMGIVGCADIARSKLPETYPALRYLEQIRKSAASGAAIVSQLMTFSRRRRPEAVTLDLNQVLVDTREMLQRLIGRDVRLEIEVPADPLWIRCDPGQIEQILMNLSANARHAMPRGGILRVATTKQAFSPAQLASLNLAPGDYAVLAVKDTGTGMDEATKHRMFEPFFTTKGPGRGTGLGLSTVYGIVQQNNGHIEVDTELGSGTEFRIFLPCSEPPARRAVTASQAPSARHEHETVLLVEDEPLVREAAGHYLEVAGYRVIATSDGAAALDILRTTEQRIDLILTDVVMPDIGGSEVSRQARNLRPELPVLFISAHPRELLQERGLLDPGTTTLPKPIEREELLLAVRAALDTRAASSGDGKQEPSGSPSQPAVEGREARAEPEVHRETPTQVGSDPAPGTSSAREARPALLLIEDEAVARMATRELLSEYGFDVFDADSARAARLQFDSHRDELNAIVTDIRLPDGSGADLVQEFRRQKPTLAVILVSGLSASDGDVEVERVMKTPRTRFVEKPVEVQFLAETVSALLQ